MSDIVYKVINPESENDESGAVLDLLRRVERVLVPKGEFVFR